ncbi:hypothetical protein [Halorubrum vacuolatum]|uniref:Uncharacterized protein n=1 Tax=Halorubrum vacuolatum TaxID=63740 RepID=A0A238YAK3_HALVU|nr:hypothetical protein [Halorubrum vacuolatum]SNR67653.1 hypothetical protein SAMN06264855_1349 [Halorubrum vacuolatum]
MVWNFLNPFSSQGGDNRVDPQKRIYRAEREIEKAEQGISECRDEYLEQLQKGANSSAGRRRVCAVRARIAKFKSNIYELKRLKAVKNLSQSEIADGMSEVEEMLDDISNQETVNEVLDADPADIENRITEAEAELASGMKDIDSFLGNVENTSTDIPVETTEEDQLMDRLAAGDIDVDDIESEMEDLSAVDADQSVSMESMDFSIDR